MSKMNDTIARQAILAQKQGESLTEFFRAKGVARMTGYAYLSRWKRMKIKKAK